MDRKPHKLGGLLLGLGLIATAAIAQDRAQLREEVWLSESGRLEALSSEPVVPSAELVRRIARHPGLAKSLGFADWRERLRLGALLFKNPFLFGGQAAKVGLSCHSCHVNGRDNPHFQFPGISGEPGTADITHSFFSQNLGNGAFDPVPIPDLIKSGKVDHSLASGELEAFIRAIIVDEFSGSKPDEYVVGALATYVRALALYDNPGDQTRVDRAIASDLDEVQSTIVEARTRLKDRSQGNHRLSRLLLAGARHRLALVHERLVDPDQAPERKELEDLSRGLGSVQSRLADADIDQPSASAALADWLEVFAERTELESLQATSLYDRERLARHLGPGE